jgi:signal transduction histidine kinase
MRRLYLIQRWSLFEILVLFFLHVSGVAASAQTLPVSNAVSLAAFHDRLADQGRVIDSFHLSGVVCEALPDRNAVVLQDDSATALIELPMLPKGIQTGDVITLAADHCAVTLTRNGIQFACAPVVNNDGHHASVLKKGDVYLGAGMQPVRLTWFNGRGPAALQVEIEGPNLPRQLVPDSMLFRATDSSLHPASFETGLAYAAYTGTNWGDIEPDFPALAPVARGVASNFALRYGPPGEGVGLAFDGFISIPTSGVYTFYLTSDDGAYLYVGRPSDFCRVSVERHELPVPAPKPAQVILAGGGNHQWAQLEGQVAFVSRNQNGIDLEVTGNWEPIQAEIVDPAGLLPENLLHRRVRLTGVLENPPIHDGRRGSRLVVPTRNQVEMVSAQAASAILSTNRLLTTIKELRNLTPAQASLGLPVRIRGVVIWRSPFAFVLQDGTAGVYTKIAVPSWTAQPDVGGFWEISGKSDPGDFSPVLYASNCVFLGNAALPEPIHPTWDQILNGSLDAEYVELRGALTHLSPSEMTLLTSDGKIQIQPSDDHPLPELPPLPDHQSYLDSIVRIRGCFTAHWNPQTRQIIGGEIWLSPGIVEVDELAPRDPFSIASKRVSDLLWFDPNLSALRRTKVKGTIILTANGVSYLQDGRFGLRLQPRQPSPLPTGCTVEAVGFLRLGGPSPVLQEAQTRIIGSADLPEPASLAEADLRDASHDATRVRIEARLVEDRSEQGTRVLEMQAGQNHFIARVCQSDSDWTPLAPGSLLRLTGVYVSESDAKTAASLDAFELWLTSSADLVELQRPPWWNLRRALAIVGALCAVLALAVIWIAQLRQKVRVRTAQLKKEIEERQFVEQRRVMEEERTRVAQDLHDELGAGLTEVGLLGDLVKNPIVPIPEKQQYLAQLTEIARSLVTSLDAIVWAINPRYDSAASLASYYTLFAQRFLNLAGIACRPEIPADFPECPLDPKDRHELFLAFKEALNNIIRHAGATEVRLKIELRDEELMITITDNGCGIQPSPNQPGAEGLDGMRRRMEQLGGFCKILSRPGEGTQVELRLPVGNFAT